jgi:hypothetical protein
MIKAITLCTLIACLVALAPATAQAANNNNNTNSLNIPVTGTGSAGAFIGTFHIVNFTFQNGQVFANGIISGTVTSSAGIVTSIVQTASAQLAASGGASAAAASCTILHLVLGPINLNILGLQITTNQIVLDISAIPGAGNLLGNLLCEIANLLNNPSQTLAGLLNQVLSILQTL